LPQKLAVQHKTNTEKLRQFHAHAKHKTKGKNIFMKVQIDLNKCSVQLEICKPLIDCPNTAIIYTKDDNAILGAKLEIDETKCDGCGICIPICCGDAISYSD